MTLTYIAGGLMLLITARLTVTVVRLSHLFDVEVGRRSMRRQLNRMLTWAGAWQFSVAFVLATFHAWNGMIATSGVGLMLLGQSWLSRKHPI